MTAIARPAASSRVDTDCTTTAGLAASPRRSKCPCTAFAIGDCAGYSALQWRECTISQESRIPDTWICCVCAQQGWTAAGSPRMHCGCLLGVWVIRRTKSAHPPLQMLRLEMFSLIFQQVRPAIWFSPVFSLFFRAHFCFAYSPHSLSLSARLVCSCPQIVVYFLLFTHLCFLFGLFDEFNLWYWIFLFHSNIFDASVIQIFHSSCVPVLLRVSLISLVECLLWCLSFLTRPITALPRCWHHWQPQSLLDSAWSWRGWLLHFHLLRCWYWGWPLGPP
jgi:hypothetical protein